MALRLIVYVSTSSIPPAFDEREVASLVAKSRERNEREHVTGVLLYSEQRRFAQAIEGEAAAVGAIMDSIRHDTRHSKIVMLRDDAARARRFAGWSLGYRGNAPQIDHAIRYAEYEANIASDRALSELLRVMQHLAANPV